MGSDIWIVDLMLLNSFNGIDLASAKCNRHLIQGVWGTTFHHGLAVGGGSKDGKLERITFSGGPWTEASSRLGPRITRTGTQTIMDYISQSNAAFSFGDCTGESGWGLCAYAPRVHFHFYRDKGRGCRDASFWECLLDVPRQMNVLAEGGGNINFFGYFGTGLGEQKYNWLEVTPSFSGPLNVYGKTILRNFQNHPITFTEKQVRIYDEVSLTTGRPASATSALPGSSPANAVDRNFRTFWEASAGSDLEVDLGRSQFINRFGIESAGLMMTNSLNTLEAELWTSEDGHAYVKAGVLETYGAAWCDMPIAPRRARYVKLRVTKPGADGIIRVASFDVYGDSNPADRPANVESR
jgi:hypothetical protein